MGGRILREDLFPWSNRLAHSQSGVTAAARQNEFTTSDVYSFERELAELHPDNEHVKEKIRQQLQELRDRNLLLHVDRNRWRLPL